MISNNKKAIAITTVTAMEVGAITMTRRMKPTNILKQGIDDPSNEDERKQIQEEIRQEPRFEELLDDFFEPSAYAKEISWLRSESQVDYDKVSEAGRKDDVERLVICKWQKEDRTHYLSSLPTLSAAQKKQFQKHWDKKEHDWVKQQLSKLGVVAGKDTSLSTLQNMLKKEQVVQELARQYGSEKDLRHKRLPLLQADLERKQRKECELIQKHKQKQRKLFQKERDQRLRNDLKQKGHDKTQLKLSNYTQLLSRKAFESFLSDKKIEKAENMLQNENENNKMNLTAREKQDFKKRLIEVKIDYLNDNLEKAKVAYKQLHPKRDWVQHAGNAIGGLGLPVFGYICDAIYEDAAGDVDEWGEEDVKGVFEKVRDSQLKKKLQQLKQELQLPVHEAVKKRIQKQIQEVEKELKQNGGM